MSTDQYGDTPVGADDRSRWGRSKFGAGRLPALWVAAPLGAVGAVTLAAVVVMMESAGSQPVLGGIAIALVLMWPLTGLVWVVIVDRDTLRGATKNPEQSIESFWHDRAASRAFTDTLLIGGLATAAISLSGIEISAVFAVAGIVLFSMSSFGIRYLLLRRQG